jgi:hypothetical protein
LRAFQDWQMKGTTPPPSRFPPLADATLARADKASTGFPTLPGLRAMCRRVTSSAGVRLRLGPQFNAQDGSGIAANALVKQVLAMWALGSTPTATARWRAGGAARRAVGHLSRLERHVGGALPFHKDQICNTSAAIPFAHRYGARSTTIWPSIEERYGCRRLRGRAPPPWWSRNSCCLAARRR